MKKIWMERYVGGINAEDKARIRGKIDIFVVRLVKNTGD